MQRVRSGCALQFTRQSHRLAIDDFLEPALLDRATFVQELAMDVGDELAANSLFERECEARELSAYR